ncbi:AAA family ATPase [Nonomuraea sp. LPB2021202275-12-8]|uniref:AAA family ATPase n=1 Tax=Nonomuraea sp. LPB2021202275-12-8 TaxID=3120159 RepID=UPI00300D09E0
MLIVMSGLPGAGKSAVAAELGRRIPAPVLSVDPAEAAMWRAGVDRDQPTGLAAYVVVEALAGEILALGQPVIVDAVNDAEEAREQWRALARRSGAALRLIEVICSDPEVHRRRLEGRHRETHLRAAHPGWAAGFPAARGGTGADRRDRAYAGGPLPAGRRSPGDPLRRADRKTTRSRPIKMIGRDLVGLPAEPS